MDETYRLAKAVCAANMAPRGLDTPEKAMVAIMHGLEVGLTPMAALQRIAVVNGRPTIWGDGAIGLVRASGLCEFVRERVEGSGDARAAICEAKRKGESEPIVRTFSVADAKTASLWNKQGPWQQYPDRMLTMRARAFALRDLFADVLGGLHVREELDEDHASAPTPPTPPSPPEPPAAALMPPVPPAPPEPESAFVPPADLVEQYDAELSAAADGATFDEVAEAWAERINAMPRADRERAQAVHEAHSKRIG